MIVEAPISIGELLDKLSILQIKKEKVLDKRKLGFVVNEHSLLVSRFDEIDFSDKTKNQLLLLWEGLQKVNEKIWDLEAVLREQVFSDAEFSKLAKLVHSLNDERASLKYRINTLAGSSIVEIKSHRNVCL